MDQAEAVGALAIAGEPAADGRDRSGKQRFLRRHRAPSRRASGPNGAVVAEARLEIPGEARETGGAPPGAGVGVHARRNRAERLERAEEIVTDAGLDAGFPIEEHDVARLAMLACAIDWMISPSEPATGLGVMTTPERLSAIAQSSSEATAAREW